MTDFSTNFGLENFLGQRGPVFIYVSSEDCDYKCGKACKEVLIQFNKLTDSLFYLENSGICFAISFFMKQTRFFKMSTEFGSLKTLFEK